MNVTIPNTTVDKAAGMVAQPYDFEAILPLDLIREHTKTDDVPSVTDRQLVLYRAAALQAAEKYTGMLVAGRQIRFEAVEMPKLRRSFTDHHPTYFIHELAYPTSDGIIFYYGFKNQASQQLFVTPGTRTVRLPWPIDFGIGCCNPNGGASSARLMYHAGYSCEADIPAAIPLGALKYIAHSVENAGDNVTVTTASNNKLDRPSGTNDPAIASGAMEIWRAAVPDAI